MSIARAARQVLKVRRTLMFSAARCPVHIKDLKDLRALLCRRDTIDMQDLKDLKRCFSRGRSRGTGPRATVKKTPPPSSAIAGDRPPRYGEKNALFTVGRGPVPRHRRRNLTFAGDRPPRYGEKNGTPHRRARACPSPSSAQSNARGGQAPALREKSRPGGLSYREIETGRSLLRYCRDANP